MLPNICEPEMMLRQVSLCEEILSILNIVEPGITRRRGQVLRVMVITKLKLMKMNPPAGLQLMKQMKQMMMLLKEIGKCKEFDSKAEQDDWSKLCSTVTMVIRSSTTSQ